MLLSLAERTSPLSSVRQLKAQPSPYIPPNLTLQASELCPQIWLSSDRAPCSTSYRKPNRWTNFSNLFLEWNSTCFGQFLCPSGVFYCTHSNGIRHTGLLTACEQDQDGTGVPSWSCSQAVSRPVWRIPLLRVQWKTPDDGQRNCPKHVEFHSKNKFEKLVHLVGFIIRNLPIKFIYKFSIITKIKSNCFPKQQAFIMENLNI